MISVQAFIGAKETIYSYQSNNLSLLRKIKAERMEADFSSFIAQVRGFSYNINVVQAMTEFKHAFNNLREAPVAQQDACYSDLRTYYNENFAEGLALANFGTYPYEYIPPFTRGRILQCRYILNMPVKDSYIDEYTNTLTKYTPVFENYIKDKDLHDILLIDNEGNIIYSHNMDVDFGANVLTAGYVDTSVSRAYQKARDAGDTHDSDYVGIADFTFYLPNKFQPLIAFSVPLIDLAGNTLGAMVVTFNSERIGAILSDNGAWEDLGETGESFMIGQDRIMRTNSRYVEKFDEYVQTLDKLGYNAERLAMIKALNTSVMLQQIKSDAVERALNGETGTTITYDYTGKKVISAFMPLKLSLSEDNYLDWGLIVKISYEEANAPVHTLLMEILKAAILIFIGIIGLTMLVSSNLIRPLYYLRDTAATIAAGDYNVRLDDKSLDEIGELSRAFDIMTAMISKRTDDLKQEKDFISAILDSQIILLMITDENRNILRIDKKMEISSGYLNGELEGTNPARLFPDFDFVKTFIDRVYTDVHQTFTTEIRTKSNSIRLTRWTVSKMTSDEHDDYLVWTGVDITEQKEVERKLEYSENALQSLTKNAQDAMFIVNSSNHVVLWNTSAERMFGYQINEVDNNNIVPILFPEKYQHRFQIDPGSSVTMELEGQRKNGDVFPIELSMTFVKVQDNWKTLYIARDVSLRKHREDELKKAYEKARLAEKSKMEFLANMSHEIRTPLNGILGFLELLQQTKMTAVQGDYLKIINNSTDSLLGIINDILDFSKIESGRIELENVEFNLFAVFEHVAELYMARANEKKVTLLLDLDTNIPTTVMGDSLRIRQVLANLLSNAIKFTPSGGTITIAADLMDKNPENCYVRLSVSDTGVGISEDSKVRIFQAFSQADTSVTRRYGGTGLGLAISAKLTKLMDSQLSLESKIGVGSKFWFDVKFEIGKTNSEAPSFKGVKAVVLMPSESVSPHEKTLIRYLVALRCDVAAVHDMYEMDVIKDIDVVFFDATGVSATSVEVILQRVPDTSALVIIHEAEQTEIKSVSRDAHTMFKPINFSKLVNVLTDISYGGHVDANKKIANELTFTGDVLVAEDNAINQQLINIMLSNIGINVEIAENGILAYEKATHKRYDLIFMDIHMPIMDGVTTTKKIISWERESNVPHVPIVALTANVIQEDQLIYAEAGMDDFIPKPIVKEKLLNVLSKYLVSTINTNTNASSELMKLSNDMGIDDVQFLKSILVEFVSMAETQMTAMRDAIAAENYDEAINYGMNMYSAVANMQFSNIIETIEQFNDCCKKGSCDTCITLLDNLVHEVDKIKQIYAL
jgi:PAS domain S-box-containing protein